MSVFYPRRENRNRPNSSRGFTLTEIAIVLGIIGLILGAIWTAASSVYNNIHTTNAHSAVLKIAQGVRALHDTSLTTGVTAVTDETTVLIAAGVIPSSLVAGGSVVGPFSNGTTAVMFASDGGGFMIVMSAVPQSNCIALLTLFGGNGGDPELYNDDAVADAPPTTGDADITGSPTQLVVTPSIAAGGQITIASVGHGGTPHFAGGCQNAMNKIRIGFILK